MSKSSSKERRRCFFDVTIDGESAGRIVVELYDDVAPRTCENFAMLCTGQAGIGKVTGKNLHYKGTMFHRVIRGFMIQGGDFSAGNGTGGESIYGGTFEDEEFIMKHDEPFVLSMANIGPDTNGSQFFITTNPAKHLNGVHVAFGKVISGKELVTRIENLKCTDKKRPVNDVIISNCGQLVRKRKASHSDDDDSKEKDRRSHKRKHKKKRSVSSDAASKHNRYKEVKEEIKIFSTVKPEDLPEEPPGGRGKFLRRRSPSSKEKGDAKERKSRRDRSRSRDRGRRNTNIRVLRSGHKVKGRGAIRFYTDDTFGREKSSTPPHWKREEMRLISLKELNKKKEEQKSREQKFSTEFETFRRTDAKPSTREYKDLDRSKNDNIHNRISFTRSHANDEPNGGDNDVAMVEELEKDGNEIVIPAMEDDDDSDDEKSAAYMHEEFAQSDTQIKENNTIEYESKKLQSNFEVGNVELQFMDESAIKSVNGKDASSSKQNLKQNDEKRGSLPSTDVSDNDQAPEESVIKMQTAKSSSSTSSASSKMSFTRSDSIPPEEVVTERNRRRKLQKGRNSPKHSPQRQPKSSSRSRSHPLRDTRHQSHSPSGRKRPRSRSPRRNLRSRSRSVKRRRESSERRHRSRSRSADRKQPPRRDERRRSCSNSLARRHDRNRRRRDSRSADRDRRRRRSRSEERNRRRRRTRSGERSRRRNSRSVERNRRRDSRSVERSRVRRISRSPNRNRRSSSGGWRPGAFYEGRMEKEIRLHGRRAALRRRNVSPIRKSRRSTSKDKKRSPSSSSLSSSSSSSTSSKSAQSKNSKGSKSSDESKSSRSSSNSSSSAASSQKRDDRKKSSRSPSKERVANGQKSRSRSHS